MKNLTWQAREDAPFLKKFSNDWPTKALAMQLLKNKRSYSYRRGYIEVPDKYAYLKKNAAKKIQGRRNDEDDAREDAGDSTNVPGVVASGSKSGSKSKRAAPATAGTQQPKKKKKTNTPDTNVTNTQAQPTAKGKRQQKACLEREVEEEDEDDDDEDEDETQGQGGEDDDEDDDVVDQE